MMRDGIILGHEGERVLIAGNAVLGYFPDERSAVRNANSRGLHAGEFLVQRCITKDEEHSMFYNAAPFYV